MKTIRQQADEVIALRWLKSHGFRQGGVLVVGLLFMAIGLHYIFASHAATPSVSVEPENGSITAPATSVTDSQASNGKAIKFGPPTSSSCTISPILVNSCRPWLGAWANKYTKTPNGTAIGSGLKAQILYHEQRIGHQLDVVKDFKQYGNTLSSDDVYFAARPNTILEANWHAFDKKWADANGSNATVNAAIDSMADSIKAVAPHQVMLSIAHEPENKVSAAPGCGTRTLSGTVGTAADYRAMWQNVENRFAAKHVTNVVWTLIYQGNATWACMEKDLWPGNSLVDWVLWDPYNFGSNTVTWQSKTASFYNWLTQNSDATHDFLTLPDGTPRPWGLGEWGMSRGVTQAATYAYYDEAKTALEANTFPRLKLYIIFDSVGPNSGGTFDDLRTQYDVNGNLDQTEQDHYNTFANSSAFKNP